MFFILISSALSLFVAWMLVFPHLQASAAGASYVGTNTENDTLSDQKERCAQILVDLELDYSTDKLSEEEYTRMKNSVSAELADILKKLDESSSK